MEWNVYVQDFNSDNIIIRNVFDYITFNEEVIRLIKDKSKMNKVEFTNNLDDIAMYYFWCKYEHEIVITTFPPYITDNELNRLNNDGNTYQHQPKLNTTLKVDIYQQLKLNWDKFVEYVYSF